MPRSLVVLALLLASTPLLGSVDLGPERPLTSSPSEPATGTGPLIASNGSGYLLAWSWPFSTFVLPLANDGTPLARRGTPVGDPSKPYKSVEDIASDGTDYVIVTSSPEGVDTIAVSGESTPRVLARTKIASPPVAPPYYAQPSARIAFAGDRYLLVYSRQPGVKGVMLDRRGVPVSEPFDVDTTQPDPDLSVASNGDGFVVAEGGSTCQPIWGCVLNSVYTVAVSKDGRVISRTQLGGTNSPVVVRRSLVFTGKKYVLVWTDSAAGTWAVNEVPVDAAGVPERGATPLVLSSSVTGKATVAMAAVATSSGAAILTVHDKQLAAMRIDANGDPIDAHPFPVVGSPVAAPDAAWNGSRLFAVWPDPDTQTLLGGTLDLVGSTLAEGASLAEQLPDERIAALDPQLLVWSERGALYATHLDEMERVKISDGTQQGKAAIANDGTDSLVVWQEGPAMRMRVVRRHGMTAIVDLASGTFDAPFAMWTGNEYLVEWTRGFTRDDGAPDEELMAIRVSRDGEPLEPEPRYVTAGPGFTTGYAQIVKTDGGLRAVFLHGIPVFFRGVLPVLKRQVFVAPVSPAGDFTAAPALVANDPDRTIGDFHVGASPVGVLAIAWTAFPLDYHLPSGTGGEIVDADLHPLRTFDFAPATATPAVAWSADSFWVSWTTDRIYVARYGLGGLDVDAPLSIDAGPAPHDSAGLTPIGNGVFVAYPRPLPETSGADTQRIVGRSIFNIPRRRIVRGR